MPMRFCLAPLALLLLCLPVRAEIQLEDLGEPTEATIAVPAPAGSTTVADGVVKQDLNEIMLFRNEDLLHGTLSGISEDGLVWKRDDVKAPIVFETGELVAVRMRRGMAPSYDGTLSRIELTNGDALFGTIISLDEEQLILQTVYAGRMTVRKPMIQAIYPDDGEESAILAGPGSRDDWNVNGSWEIKGNKMSGQGTIGRDVGLPDMARISMRVKWKGRYPNFSLALYTSDSNSNNANNYMLSVSSSSLYLNRNVARSNSTNLGHQNMQELMQMTSVDMEILVNKEARSISLMMNGNMVKQWVDPKEWNGSGTGLVFFCHDNNNSKMTFENLRVTNWDGKFPEPGSSSSDMPEDLVEFTNEDKVSGTLRSIKDGKASFETAYAPPLVIPLNRVVRLVMSTPKAQKPRRNAGDVEAYFPTGEHITVKLESVKDRELKGWSETFGTVTMKTDAFVGLRFNLYAEAEAEGADLDDDDESLLQNLTEWLLR